MREKKKKKQQTLSGRDLDLSLEKIGLKWVYEVKWNVLGIGGGVDQGMKPCLEG